MYLSTLDYSEYPEIREQLKQPTSAIRKSLGELILEDSRTKVYLINEFDLQGDPQIVVVVKYWDGTRQQYSYTMCIWDKKRALKV